MTLEQNAEFPRLGDHLPELAAFIVELAQAYQAGEMTRWEDLVERTHAFFSPGVLSVVDAVAPGWHAMAAYGDGITLVHVMCVFTGLLNSPEFQRATPSQREMMLWIVLFHDITKIVYDDGRRDNTHGFRSAASAGQILPQLGFPIRTEPGPQLAAWATQTAAATTRPAGAADDIQDNGQLPEIVAGIDHLFGANTPAALIIKAVLLHLSVTVVSDWPQVAPLAEDELRRYVNAELRPLLKMMMLADNDGWSMFEPQIKAQQRRETLATFRELEQQA